MSQPTLTGTCSLCRKAFSRRSMTQHLISCGLPDPKLPAAGAPAKPPNRSFHLFVDVRYAKEYWLHLAGGRIAGQCGLFSAQDLGRMLWAPEGLHDRRKALRLSALG